jgi:ATP-dependent 26S proteasome regulatory subunit
MYYQVVRVIVRFDSRVKAMEVDEKPTEDYNDVGGLDKQIEELVEAIVLPMTHAEKFKNLGIRPPKGCLMYGPPGNELNFSDAHIVKEREKLCWQERVLPKPMLVF